MQLVDVTLTPLQRRTGAVWLPWHQLAAQQRGRGDRVRVLSPGDDVMLRFEDGSVQRGWVMRNATAGDEGAYVILFGRAVGRRAPVSPQRRPEPRVEEVVVEDVRIQDVRVRVVPPQRERRRVNLYL
ncbi:hypothetical protein [Nocardioides pocheonensis]|uniref:Uncharacterized protein n=1 Tax=Nocardioides pocheonensis TaxID=661485 RepID=A0A3N0GJY7_9ACTN|nr:hypothetical protein [Nocardioides pocheonensis]RNM12526.1 hypothetical protein EFL26_18010 [Nocardioides pocheonensis]